MSSPTPQPDLHHDCLAKLNRALDLVLKSAETASAEGNHKVVIQAAREVTRIVTLITKMTDPQAKSTPKSNLIPLTGPAGPVSSGGRQSNAPPACKNQKTPSLPGKAGSGHQAAKSNRAPGKQAAAFALPDLKSLLQDSSYQPDDADDLDPISLKILQDIMK